MTTVPLAELVRPAGKRAGAETDLPVYSVTKHAGFVPSLEYFKKQVFSRDLAGYKLVEPGDFAYATIHLDEGSIGIAPERGLISPMYTVFRTDDSRVDPDFLIRFLKSPRALSHYPQLGKGAVHRRKAISLAALGSLPVPLPPVPQQRRVAAILDHADTLRARRREVLNHLDALSHSLFHQMFSGGEFELVSLEEVIKWNSGKFLPAKEQNGGEHAVYGGNGVNGSHDEFMFEEPRLVVGRVGAYCGAVHVTQPRSWVTDNALIATLLRDDLTLDYLLPALSVANLNQYAGISGQPSISGGKIGNVQLAVPPLDLQRRFADRVASVRDQVTLTQAAASADAQLYASIQDRAFRGQL